MKLSVKIKILVDICMTAALLACMSYLLIGEKTHEWSRKRNNPVTLCI